MWLIILTVLLLSTICAGADKGVHFAIKELHNQVSPIAKTANDLYLESELLNGKVDLVKKVLGDNLHMFEEYSQMDISSGIPEQNEVLELVEKAETSRTSDETRKKIENGFETMEDIKDFQFGNDNFSRIPDELKKIETSSRLDEVFTEEGRDIVKDLYYSFKPYERYVRSNLEVKTSDPAVRKRILEELDDLSDRLSKQVSRFENYIEGLSIETSSFNPIDALIRSIEELIPVNLKIKSLENLSQDLTLMETEMKVLKELGDSQAPKQIQTLTKKLETTVDQISVQESVKNKYQRIETASKLLEKISLFTSFLSTTKWKFDYLKKQWSPVEEYLNNLEISSEDLSKPFLGLRDCVNQQDISFTSSYLKEEVYKVDEQFKRWHALQHEFKLAFDKMMKFKDSNEFRRSWEDGMNHLEEVNFDKREWDKFVKTIIDDATFKVKYILFTLDDGTYRSGSNSNPSLYESKLIEISRASKNVDVRALLKVTDNVKLVIDKIDQFSKCYSELKVTPESVKSLMDQSLKAWNFDPRPLESVVAVIDLFNDAHKMLGGLTSWKFEQNDFIKSFPLTSEDVTGISEGVGALEAIMKVQSGWDIMRESMEDSDVKDALAKFSEELSHLEMDANLPKIQELLSNVQFPNNFDAVIDFYKNRYQGSRRRDILKILEVFKTLDFPSYPSKLEKMNQAIGMMRKWAGDQEKLGDQDDEKPWIDCAMSTCDNVLKLPETQEDPVPEVSL